MTTATCESSIMRIGATAGVIWRLLDAHGPLSISRLVKEVDAPRDLVMQSLGWLARENKICIDDDSRTRIVSLRQDGMNG
jgi:hypothetical protein